MSDTRAPRVTRADFDRIERKLDRIIQTLGKESYAPDGPRLLPNGSRFLPGTGTLDTQPNRQRSAEVLAAIGRDEQERL